jgi:hypothetical protein
MLTVRIDDEFHNIGEIVNVLRRIAELVEQGYSSGIEPGWNLSGEPDDTPYCGECGEYHSPVCKSDN